MSEIYLGVVFTLLTLVEITQLYNNIFVTRRNQESMQNEINHYKEKSLRLLKKLEDLYGTDEKGNK